MTERRRSSEGGAKRRRPTAHSGEPTTRAATRTTAETTKYLSRVLRANPLERADDIVRGRARFLGLKDRKAEGLSAPDPGEVRESRAYVAERIDEIRERFWSMQVSHIKAAIGDLDLEPFPDLERAAERLRTVAVHRKQFPALAQERGFDSNFFECLKLVFVLPAKEAAEQRERALNLAKHPRKAKRIKKMIRSLEQQMPEVYDLEAEWFDVLRRQRPEKAHSQRASSSHSDSEGIGCSWGWWVGIVVVLRLLRLLVSD